MPHKIKVYKEYVPDPPAEEKSDGIIELLKLGAHFLGAFILPFFRIPRHLITLNYQPFGGLLLDILCCLCVILPLWFFKIRIPVFIIGGVFGATLLAGISCRMRGVKFTAPIVGELSENSKTSPGMAQNSKEPVDQGRKIILPPMSENLPQEHYGKITEERVKQANHPTAVVKVLDGGGDYKYFDENTDPEKIKEYIRNHPRMISADSQKIRTNYSGG